MRQQIAVSGLGGQGVLFVTRILAETALHKGLSVLVSETHGMAQRGGNVISHLKVSPRRVCGDFNTGGPKNEEERPFTSPLIRSGNADVLLVLHPDGLPVHGHYLHPEGSLLLNVSPARKPGELEATAIASALGSPVSANLVLLGFGAGRGSLFCTWEEVRDTVEQLGGSRLEVNLRALEAGRRAALDQRGAPTQKTDTQSQ